MGGWKNTQTSWKVKMKNKYRIVTDNYSGYEVQIKRWWFPVWRQIGINTFTSIDHAKRAIKTHKSNVVWEEGKDE